MTHAESLALLHKLGMAERTGWTTGAGFAIMVPEGVLASQSHGASAVRAVTSVLVTENRETPFCDELAVRASRLAFSAACEAIGIRPDANGHHNL